jgi:hypothetical protein
MAGGKTVGGFDGRRAVGSEIFVWRPDCPGFFIVVDEEIILLHGIIKKARTASKQEQDTARKRQASYMKAHQNRKK